MHLRLLPLGLVTAIIAIAAFQAPGVHSQQAQCTSEHAAKPFNQPDANGTTVEDRLDTVTSRNGYRFRVPPNSSAYLYVGDQWYDLDLAVFGQGACPVAAWSVQAVAASARSERRIISFVRPDEQILNLDPGEYVLIVGHKYWALPEYATDFDAQRGYRVRVAIGPRVCGLEPPNDRDNELYPGLKQRRDDAIYQLGMSFEPAPEELGPFALMTFSAVVSPPFTELFDFEWRIDGQPAGSSPVIQKPYSDLPKTALGQHKVQLTAKGAREYQDPDPQFNHTPLNGGTLTVECTLRGPA
jgi:hypothetical protein